MDPNRSFNPEGEVVAGRSFNPEASTEESRALLALLASLGVEQWCQDTPLNLLLNLRVLPLEPGTHSPAQACPLCSATALHRVS